VTRRALPIALALSVVLAGCGLSDPYSPPATKPTLPHARGPALVTPARTTAQSVLAQFAMAWGTWTYATLPQDREQLLSLASGRLATELREAAAQAVRTRLLEVSGAYSHARFVGDLTQDGGQTVVVTYEEVAPYGGHPQASYQVYLARTEYTAKGWRLIEWRPAIDG
jgi:hypothetical protein